MEVGQIGETGVHVSVITALEQEHGTELDLVPILLLSVMGGNTIFDGSLVQLQCNIKDLTNSTFKSNENSV